MTIRQEKVEVATELELLGERKLLDLFRRVSTVVGRKPSDGDDSTNETTSDEEKLKLYGLYKRVNYENPPSEDAPSMFQPVARSKFLAWKACSSMTKREAMHEYIRIATSRQDKTGNECRQLSQTFRKEYQNATPSSTDRFSASNETVVSNISEKQDSTNQQFVAHCPNANGRTTSFGDEVAKWMGVRPLVPRGRLDVSYRDLAFGLYQCMIQRNSKQNFDRLHREITHLWAAASASSMSDGTESPGIAKAASKIIVGLSVRSLFDLYLTMKGYPDGSEILVVPPISVPGMMHVAKYHNLTIVPVDIDFRRREQEKNEQHNNTNQWIHTEELQSKVTEKTVAIMLVHPFGIVTTNAGIIAELRSVADDHQLELWEDCAETFTGLGQENYLGSSIHADVRFFSFGTIKTATALGGGIALLKNADAAKHMLRLQQSLFNKQQTRGEFLRKIVTATVLNSIADSPLRVGALSALCGLCGLSFDTIVTYSVRGFSLPNVTDLSSNDKNRIGVNVSDDRWTQTYLIRQIRKRPSYALLALLHRRLEQSKEMAPSVPSRMRRCSKVASALERELPDVLLPNFSKFENTYWAFPICCRDRNTISRNLQLTGFDVASGASQLCSVSKFIDTSSNEQTRKELCPSADDLMNSILYLPICSQNLSDSKLADLIHRLQHVLESPSLDTSNLEGEAYPRPNKQKQRIFLGAIIILIFSSWIGHCSSMKVLHHLLTLIASALVFRLCGECLLRWTTAEFYLKESSAFAEHCDMVDAIDDGKQVVDDNMFAVDDSARTQRRGVIDSMEPLGFSMSSISNVRKSKRKVILTGATGFVGTALLRDILLQREILSLERIILLCRKKGKLSAESRIERLMNKPIFDFLTHDEKVSLIEVVEGDVTMKSAGLSPMDLAKIARDASISHVVHSAAAVSFTLEFPNAAESNISSSLNMQNLTGQLKNKEAQFVHISTAFVHGDKTGSKETPLPEELFDFQSFDPSEIYKSMIGTQYYASKAMSELGFPNTYSFSKSVCEHLLSQNNHVNTLIIRPSIVGPAIESPFEGWAGDRPSTIVAGPCLHLSNQWNIWHLGKQCATCFPVDVLARFVIAKSFDDDLCPKSNSNDGASSSDGSFERISNLSDESSECEDLGCNIVSQSMVDCRFFRIFNATWDSQASENALFSWVEFSTAYLHLGSVLGYFSRSSAMMQLFISAQIIPSSKPTIATLHLLQSLLIRSPFQLVAALNDYLGLSNLKITKLLTFLDLPLLFYPFVKDEFYFKSDLEAPDCFDVKRYSFSCGVAAHRFISSKQRSEGEILTKPKALKKISCFAVGGSNHSHGSSCLWWAFCQPRGNFFFRLVAAFVAYVLRRISTLVTVDLNSFRKHLAAVRSKKKNGPVYLVLVPTHRSFLDFILLSYVFFSVPELQVDLPFIVAANEFQYLPFFGWLARRLRAFYIQRGKGRIDTNISSRLESLKASHIDATFEVFIEGKRSRDRRFVAPKTGLLKSLKNSGGEHIIVPITINYECIPEQNILSEEAAGSHRRELTVTGMIFWLRDVLRGRVDIGKVHIEASDPLSLDCKTDNGFRRLVDDIQRSQQKNVVVSDYHIRAASKILNIRETVVKRALPKIGCRFWPTTFIPDKAELPTDQTILFAILLHFGHALAPLFHEKRRKWSGWLSGIIDSGTQEPMILDCDIQPLYDKLEAYFDSADAVVNDAILRLKEEGFLEPDCGHVFQTAKATKKTDVPALIIHAAVSMKLCMQQDDQPASLSSKPTGVADAKLSDGIEKLGFWGFNDSGFVAKTDDRGKHYVTMKGARYALCGKRMPKILPFMETALNIKINLSKEFPSVHPRWSTSVESNITPTDKKYLDEIVDGQLSFSTRDRLRHGTGHSQEDVFALRYGEDIRIPDVVLWPSSEEQVMALVKAAQENGWCLIPFGGGTNVIEATRCPSKQAEQRPILSVSMKRLNRIFWLNEEDGLAHVEAGITGRELVEFLERRGYTMGHEPDSIEFSTLGGWIATKASGMKRSKYGNIEDIVVSARIVTPNGVLWNGSNDQKIVPGRHSEGIDVHTLAFGSEGCLGIITSAVIRVWPLPEVRKYGSIIFPQFDDGLQFLKLLSREQRLMPACVRLLDNAHFRLGQALRPEEPSWLHQTKNALANALVSLYFAKDFDPNSVVCATISYEGNHREVREQTATVAHLSRINGGVMLGSSLGKAGYDLTFMIAYLRDFAMTYHILGESFETFVPWSRIESLIAATKERVVAEHASRLLPGVPFVGCRVTQLYHEGACLYFYMCINFEGLGNRASAIYADLERAARDEILKQGGSLSHHHGLGKLRSSFAKKRSSPEFQKVVESIKDSMDQDNVFGAQNGMFAPN